MDSIALMRRVAALLVVGGGVGLGQSTLPPTSPTSLAPTSPAAASPTSGRPNEAVKPANRASVTYVRGALEVNADDSSLNQILHDISRQTGMKINGGVADERVYGKYGPAPAAKVLESLLDGTGSNMALLESSTGAPTELDLTPRGGGPTPPNPNAGSFDEDAPSRGAVERGFASRQLPGVRLAAPVPAMRPAEPQPASGIAAPSAPDTAANADAQTPSAREPMSPNGVKTPQEIYQQLQQLQKAQTKPQ